MKEDVKNLWVAALRSGEYEQARHILHDGRGYCCLGVLCKVLGIEPKKTDGEYRFGASNSTTTLGTDIRNMAGLKSAEGFYGFSEGRNHYLSTDNDHGRNFLQIADTIEQYWKDL